MKLATFNNYTFTLLVTLASSAAIAQPKDGAGKGAEGGRRGPPAEAVQACKDLKAGNNCAFTHDSNQRKGTCFAPENKPLVCRPGDAPSRASGNKGK